MKEFVAIILFSSLHIICLAQKGENVKEFVVKGLSKSPFDSSDISFCGRKTIGEVLGLPSIYKVESCCFVFNEGDRLVTHKVGQWEDMPESEKCLPLDVWWWYLRTTTTKGVVLIIDDIQVRKEGKPIKMASKTFGAKK